LRHWRLASAVIDVVLQHMAAYTIIAVHPIHNTGSIEDTRAAGIDDFIVNVLSKHTVHRNCYRVLGRWEHKKDYSVN